MYLPIVVYSVFIISAVACYLAGVELKDTIIYLGFTLASSKILLDLLKEYQEKKAKEEEKRERVQSKLEIPKAKHRELVLRRLRVVLFNPSFTKALHIKSVVYSYRAGKDIESVSFYTSTAPMTRLVSSVDIEPQKSATFAFPQNLLTQAVCDGLRTSTPDDLSIVVSSHVGEIDRIKGQLIWEMVRDDDPEWNVPGLSI